MATTGSRIGAQMYTLRDHCKTASDIAKSCEKLKNMGFEAIQASAAGFNELSAKELKQILDDTGLACVATHKSLDEMRDIEAVVDYHKTLDCELTAIGGNRGETQAEWQSFIQEFNDLGQKLAARGLKIGYHNHSHEWAPFGGAAPDAIRPIDLLVDGLDDSVWFELDTYWIAHGGGDPTAWIERVADRIPAVHVKDMTITAEREQKMCEVGSGNLNWPAILSACQSAGVEWYLIERDRGDLDPFESLKISLENLRAMGVH
ncbi:MAG: sugar phosphate isomerase/epimerase family protein [Phycisphaeraceae bacterium]